jgi:hypothetical protein
MDRITTCGGDGVSNGSVIEVAGPASVALSRAAELRSQGWTVAVVSTRLTATCEVVWSLEVARES